jgi:hypothetical protein
VHFIISIDNWKELPQKVDKSWILQYAVDGSDSDEDRLDVPCTALAVHLTTIPAKKAVPQDLTAHYVKLQREFDITKERVLVKKELAHGFRLPKQNNLETSRYQRMVPHLNSFRNKTVPALNFEP